ncbi:Tripeptidyl-peptidase 2 [Camellia lanceoleosa]|nr:Tripeptidyl-peptidase 2 [Camellia lanceoleosa]
MAITVRISRGCHLASPLLCCVSIHQEVFFTIMNVMIIEAADEVIGSVDTDELAKYFSFKSDPEDEGLRFVSMFPVSFLLTQNPQETELLRYYLLFYGMKMKKKMETARDQLAEALTKKD